MEKTETIEQVAAPAGEGKNAADDKSPKAPVEKPAIEVVVAELMDNLGQIGSTGGVVLPHAAGWLKEEYGKIESKLQPLTAKYGENATVGTLTVHEIADFLEATNKQQALGGARMLDVLHRNLFTQIFCEYDAFIGALLKAIYKGKPELYSEIFREIKFTDLLEFTSLEEVKRDILEKEIDSFRRESYIEQFSVLEKKIRYKDFERF